jgi:proline dehydrogenase
MVRALLILALVCSLALANDLNGDKQLNNVASQAISELTARGQIERVRLYYYGGDMDNNFQHTTTTCRRQLPSVSSFTGTMSTVVSRGSVRFCLAASDQVG